MPTRYLLPIHPGVRLYLARIPADGLRWRGDVLKGLTPVMRHYGLRQKDLSAIDGFDPVADADIIKRMDKAYSGDASAMREFDLWDYTEGRFALVREASKTQSED